MKILIVNIYFYPDPTGTGLVLTELARDLVNQGHQVSVITSVPHYGSAGRRGACSPRREKSACPPAPSASLWREEDLDGIRVLRTAVYVPRHPSFWSRALNYATFTALSMAAGLSCGPHDVILCTSPPLSIGLSAWLLSRLKRTPFVFNVQDIYPDAAVLMGMVRNPALIALFQRLERFVYRKAALVTVISEGARQNLLTKGVPDEKVAVLHNWADVEHVQPVCADNEFRTAALSAGRWAQENGRPAPRPGTPRSEGGPTAGRPGTGPGPRCGPPAPEGRVDAAQRPAPKIVMFAGNIGLIAGLETVLEAADRLRRRPDIHFLIVGEGNAKQDLVARARQMDLPNVTFLTTQPREILPQVLGAADVHLVTLKRRMSTTSVPSKAYGIMASGRPMIAAVDPGSEVWRLVETAQAGVCLPPEAPDDLAKAIETLCDAPEERQRLGDSARSYVVRHNSKRELTALYGRTLEAVVSGEWSVVRSRAEHSPLAPHPSPLEEAGAE